MLWLLRLFAAFRALEAEVAALKASLKSAEDHGAEWLAQSERWQQMYERSEKRVDELTEKIANAGDAVATRLMGRRLFSKAPVEVPPAENRPPVNLSRGSSKRFARDVQRQEAAQFFADIAKAHAKQHGIPQDPQAN